MSQNDKPMTPEERAAQLWCPPEFEKRAIDANFAQHIAAAIRAAEEAAEQRGAEKEWEARIGDLVAIAAECHRHKWEFSPPDHETDPPIGCAEARRLVGRAFDVLHALGDKIMAAEAEIRACGERKGDA